MLPPVLEIYVVWHPGDTVGREIADEVVAHFHGTLFSGLIGGAVEVYVRSVGWRGADDGPRPIALPGDATPAPVPLAQLTAIVPVLGVELAAALEQSSSPWTAYLSRLVAAHSVHPDRVRLFPVRVDSTATNGTKLAGVIGNIQCIATPSANPEPRAALLCRDLAQGIAQLATPSPDPLTVFISHTKHASRGEKDDVAALIQQVRDVVAQTRLREFFDAHDLQPGRDWDDMLRQKAATSALLALRTDLYPSREWCQREVLTAKQAGMPLVILDALGQGEERGSFLMDHAPRVPVRGDAGAWSREQVLAGLNILVDECLKRALWNRQHHLAVEHGVTDVAWWAPHAPEPTTLLHWFQNHPPALQAASTDLRVLHPDPPLGPDERAVLEDLAAFGGLKGKLDLLTPRLLASRGG